MTDKDHEAHGQEEDDDIKSRSQIKREAEALQDLGKKLTAMSTAQLKEVPMGDELRAAITLYQTKITQREARRRHLQFIGKLMRSEDADAIQAVLDKYDSSSKIFAQALHELENWRTRLINDGKPAMTEYVESHPDIDVQQFRQLVRNAQKEAQNQTNRGAAKKLFQFLRTIQAQG